MARRLAMGAAMLAVPLVSAGSAHAALAGANAPSTSRPDLRSATILTDGRNGVRYCFDEALTNNVVNGGTGTTANTSFNVAGYAAAKFSTNASSATRDANPNCVTAIFAGTEDLNAFSTAQVTSGVVTGNAVGSLTNQADGTALSGSKDQSGTRSHTVGPDLIGVVSDPSSNTIFYTFDQNLATTVAMQMGAHYYNQAGNKVNSQTCAATNSSTPSPTIACTFGALAANPPTVAYVDEGVVSSRRNTSATNPIGSSAVPGSTGNTNNPDLISAVSSADGASVTYTYDQPVAVNSSTQTAFTINLSNRSTLTSTTASASGNTVTANFRNTNNVNEYFVSAAANDSAVTNPSAAINNGSTEGGVPVGGNAGAFASGFTTGPDAFSTTFNGPANQVTVTFDQRINPDAVTAASFHLIDVSGNQTASPSSVVVQQPGAPSAVTVTLNFAANAGAVNSARAIQIDGFNNIGAGATPAVRTFLGPDDNGNQEQILSPTATSSILKYSKSGKTATLKKGVKLAKVKRAHRKARHHN